MAADWSKDDIKALDTLREAADYISTLNERRLSNKRRKQTLTIKADDSMQSDATDVTQIEFDDQRGELTQEEKAFEDEFGRHGASVETSSPFCRDRYEELRYKAWASRPRQGETYVDFAGYRLGEPIGRYRRHCPISRRDGVSEDFRREPQSMETELTDQATKDGFKTDRSLGRDIGMVDAGGDGHEPESSPDSIDETVGEKRMGSQKTSTNQGSTNDADRVDAAQGGDREATLLLRQSGARNSSIRTPEELENRENALKEEIMKKKPYLDIGAWEETKNDRQYKVKMVKYAQKKLEWEKMKSFDNLTQLAKSASNTSTLKYHAGNDSTDGNSFKSILMGTLCGTTASELPGTEENEETSICDTMPVLLAAVTAVKRENDLSRWKGIVEHGWSNVGADKFQEKRNIEYYIHPDGLGMPKFRNQIWALTGTSKYGFKASLRQTVYAIRDRLVEKGFDVKLVRMALQKRDFSHFDMEHIICRLRDHSDF